MYCKTITFNLFLFTSTIFAQISGIVIDSNNAEPGRWVNTGIYLISFTELKGNYAYEKIAVIEK